MVLSKSHVIGRFLFANSLHAGHAHLLQKNLQTILFWHDICPSPHLQTLRSDSISCMALSLTTTPLTVKPVWKMRIFHLPEDGITTTYIRNSRTRCNTHDLVFAFLYEMIRLRRNYSSSHSTAYLIQHLQFLQHSNRFLFLFTLRSSSARTRAQ